MTFADTMQAFSSFAWMPDFMQPQNHEKMACSTPRPNPIANMSQSTNTLKKRKRMEWSLLSSSPEVVAKKQKQVALAQARSSEASEEADVKVDALEQAPAGQVAYEKDALSTRAPSTTQDSEPVPHRLDTRNPQLHQRAKQQIEAHFNLEILYKHNELRLIEQEMAKCQVALEQLRRCRAIPFPGQPGSSISTEQIANGTGPRTHVPPGYSQPQDPAAWGVTDGPYSRHYAQWLIPDPRFDPTPVQHPPRPQASGKVPGRSARKATTPDEPAASRSGRRATAAKLQGLPNYATARDRSSTLTIRRASDGLMVKLVCRFCGKDNVSSLQGFLNHCRIQHKYEYSSHNAALEDCGVPLDEAELASLNVSGVEQLPSSSNVVVAGNNNLLVHPLIRENRRELPSSSSSPSSTQATKLNKTLQPQRIPSGLSNSLDGTSDFKPSSSTPALSAYLAKLGSTGNLSSFVEHTRDRSDFDNICEQLPSDDEVEAPKPAPAKPKHGGRARGRRSTIHAAANTAGTPAPLRLQLPAHRAVQSISEGSPYSFADASSIMSASTNFTATPATEFTMSPYMHSAVSPHVLRALTDSRPRSDIRGFTSTFGYADSPTTLDSTMTTDSIHAHSEPVSEQKPRPLILKLKTSQYSVDKNGHVRAKSQSAISATPAEIEDKLTKVDSPANADTGMISDNEESDFQIQDTPAVKSEPAHKPMSAMRTRSSANTSG